MLLEIIKILFIISAIMFSFLIVIHKQYTLKVKDNVKISNFVAIIAFSLVAYIVGAFLIAILSGSIKYKILMILFAISPFVIGKFSTYRRIKIFSLIQIIVMLIGATVVYLK